MLYKSQFNYIYKKDNESWVFFNTFTGALVVLDNYHKNLYDNFSNTDGLYDEKFANQMLDLGFLLCKPDEDLKIVNSSRENTMYNDKVAYLRILTTTACNARCEYCYEKEFQSKHMTLETSDKLVNYILSLPKLDKFYIHWFGGEPLLNVKIIDNVMLKVYDILTERGTKVYVYFTSNGSLITKELAQKAANCWHANWFQITIDDIDYKYDVIKNYTDKKYNFDLVIKNIGKLLKNNITVILRINYLPTEVKKVKDVIDYLYAEYKDYCESKLLIFSPAPIFNMNDNLIQGIKEINYYNLFEPNKYLIEKGLLDFNNAYGLVFKSGQCYACHYNSFVVDPSGNLYKCTVTIKEENACVGNIFNGVDKNKYYYRWVNHELPQECNECTFLPICQGGCKAGYLGYMDVSCKRVIKELEEILNYKISSNLSACVVTNEDIYLN